MKNLLRSIADESVLVLGCLTSVTSLLVVDEPLAKALIAIGELILALLVRMVTSSPSTVVEVARQTAEGLVDQTVGTVGTVTKSGEEVINTVIDGVGGLVPSLAPKLGVKEAP